MKIITENIDTKADTQKHDSQGDAQDKFSFVIFQRHGRGHGPGESFGVTPEHHADSHFCNDPPEGHDNGGHDGKAGFADNDPGGLDQVCAKGQGGLPVSVIDTAHSRDGEGRDDGNDKNYLADDNGLLCVKKIIGAENAPPGDKGIDKETHHYCGEGEKGVEQGDDQSLSPKLRKGNEKS